MRHIVAVSLALLFATFALGITVLGSFSALATAEDINPVCRENDGEVEAEDLPASFDLSECPIEDKVIKDDGAGAKIPPPGQGVAVHVTTTDGAQEFSVEHREDGTVNVKDVEEKPDKPEVAPSKEALFEAQGGPSACRDRTYNLYSWKAKSRFEWKFGRLTTPRHLNKRAAQRQLVLAARAIPRSKNDCGMRDLVDAKQKFLGKTSSRAQIDKNAYCKSGLDSENVVSFGKLPANYLAMACSYYYFDSPRNRLKTSDIKINIDKRWSTNRRNCKRKIDLRAVMTHEFGHTFGLDHVSETTHGNLTMSTAPSNRYCDTSARTLGRGDVRGLRALY